MVQPDGLMNLFLRTEANGNVLNGSAGWKGEISGDKITAWASCGWKIVFASGRIASLTTPKGRRLDWIYEGGRVTEVREGSTAHLKVGYKADGRVNTVNLSEGKSIIISQDMKPRIALVGNQSTVTGAEKSLSRLIMSDGVERIYAFDVDDKTRPTLNISSLDLSPNRKAETKKFCWDANTKLIVRDDHWSYTISKGGQSENASIEREGDQGKKESWFNDTKEGKETVKFPDGDTKIVYRFVSGILSGKIRRIEQGKNGVMFDTYKADYDTNGRIQREIAQGSKITYSYNADGSPKSAYMNDKLLWTRIYDSTHKVLKITSFLEEKPTTTTIQQP